MSKKFHSAIKEAKQLLENVHPSYSHRLIGLLVTMQSEYYDAITARDHYERELNRLVAAVMAEKLNEADAKLRDKNTRLVLSDGTGKQEKES